MNPNKYILMLIAIMLIPSVSAYDVQFIESNGLDGMNVRFYPESGVPNENYDDNEINSGDTLSFGVSTQYYVISKHGCFDTLERTFSSGGIVTFTLLCGTDTQIANQVISSMDSSIQNRILNLTVVDGLFLCGNNTAIGCFDARIVDGVFKGDITLSSSSFLLAHPEHDSFMFTLLHEIGHAEGFIEGYTIGDSQEHADNFANDHIGDWL